MPFSTQIDPTWQKAPDPIEDDLLAPEHQSKEPNLPDMPEGNEDDDDMPEPEGETDARDE